MHCYFNVLYDLNMLPIFGISCHLLLGEVENAKQYFNKCSESVNGVCLDRRIVINSADGLQKIQVLHLFCVIMLHCCLGSFISFSIILIVAFVSTLTNIMYSHA